MQKFLVIQTAFIGDVVLATALLERLHACFPDAHIDFLVRKGNEALLAGHPYLHETLVWDKKQHKLKNLWVMARRIRRERYDKVINVQRFAATGLLTVFSGAKETIGFDKNPLSRFFTRSIPHVISAAVEPGKIPQGPTVHEVQRNQALIASFTDDRPARPRLYPTPADEQKVEGYKHRPYMTVSPASVWFTKQYPADQWAEFIRLLAGDGGELADVGASAEGDASAVGRPGASMVGEESAYGRTAAGKGAVAGAYTVYLLGAAVDTALAEKIMAMAGSGVAVDLTGRLSFLQSTALMRGAVMNYVNDSAPMHFASSVNAPVTAVYCSTIPGFGFGPLSDNSHIVEVEERLSCRPCGLHGYRVCPQGHFNCARHIQARQLLETLTAEKPSAGPPAGNASAH